MAETKDAKILVVDDEMEMRQMIVDFLHDVEGYEVIDAPSGKAALEILEKEHVDIVVSDINMPGMRGFDLLKIVKEKYPEVKRLLITAYDVDDYLDMALKYDIGNIFVKTTPFHFQELSVALDRLLTSDIFGIDRYFEPGATRTVLRIKDSKYLDQHAQVISGIIEDRKRSKRLEVVIVELLTNAIFYGIRQESPEKKETWDVNFKLADDMAIVVTTIRDQEKYGISIADEGGRLKKSDVLYWMNRQISRDENGLPVGLYDLHGRGLFITRRYIDRLIINVKPGFKTETIIINYYSKTFSGFKPLYINEI